MTRISTTTINNPATTIQVTLFDFLSLLSLRVCGNRIVDDGPVVWFSGTSTGGVTAVVEGDGEGEKSGGEGRMVVLNGFPSFLQNENRGFTREEINNNNNYRTEPENITFHTNISGEYHSSCRIHFFPLFFK